MFTTNFGLELHGAFALETDEKDDDNLFYCSVLENEPEEFECLHEIVESEYDNFSSSGSSVTIENIASGAITTSLPDNLQHILDLEYSRFNPFSSLSDQTIDSSGGGDRNVEILAETTEVIRLYKKRFQHAKSTPNSKRDTILDRPQSYPFGESPAVKNYIRSVIRIQIYTYFNVTSHSECDQKTTLHHKLDLIGTNGKYLYRCLCRE